MKEYLIENGKPVSLEKLKGGWLPGDVYSAVDANLSRVCHDIMLEYKGGALLAVRTVHPAKDELWPIGGRFERGLSTEDSIRKKVKSESDLDVYDIEYLDVARTFFDTDGCGHGRGTDTVDLMFWGRTKGELRLDETFRDPVVVVPVGYYTDPALHTPPVLEYTEEFRLKLHPYVQDFMDLVMPRIARLKIGLK